MAIRSGLLSENPCDNVELPKVKKPDIKTLSEIKGISDKDAKMIYDYFHQDEEEK